MCKKINILKSTIKFSLVGFFFILDNSFAVDSESWSSMGFGIKLPYSLKLDLEQSLRLKDNSSSFKQTFTETIISYNRLKKVKVFIPVRYAVFKNKIKKRISFGASYKHNLKIISFRYRYMIQRTYQQGKIFDPLIRNKFTLSSKINKKLRPYVSQEFSHFLKNGHLNYDEFRVSIGARINLGKKRETKIFYTQKIESLSNKNRDRTNIFGISYAFDW